MALSVGLALSASCSSCTIPQSDTVARISDSASPHNADYVDYGEGLSKTQAMDRLPHIALIGDSLSRNFYVSSLPSMLWRSKMDHGRDWFLDTDPAPGGIDSVYQRIDQITPVVAVEYASPGGFVDSDVKQANILGFLLPQHFSAQVDHLLRDSPFPDLLMIWIGHNNLDWAASLNAEQRAAPEPFLRRTAAEFRENYARELAQILDAAKSQDHRTAIVVFGLVNFKSFFEAREKAEELKSNNPELYPYLEADYERFVSMRPEYRGNMIRLALMLNDELRSLVDEFNKQLTAYPQVSLRYSDALSTVDIGEADLLNRVDAWHPSPKGHGVLAAAAFPALKPSLEFLGIVPH